jgi:hypothetical protein
MEVAHGRVKCFALLLNLWVLLPQRNRLGGGLVLFFTLLYKSMFKFTGVEFFES